MTHREWLEESEQEYQARLAADMAGAREAGRRSAEAFNRSVGEVLADLWVREVTRPAPGPIDYSRGIRFNESPTAYTNVGPAMPTPTVEDLLALKARLAPPEPEQVIITPSLDALRAVVPFAAPNAIQRRSPTDFRTTDGIRVVVTKLADRPRLVPASWVDRLVPTPLAAVFDEFAAMQGHRYRVMKDAAANAARPTRPPFGVMPAYLWREDHPRPAVDDRVDRVVELRRAIMRYVEAGQKPPLEWAAEIEEHAAVLQTGFVDAVENFLDQLDAVADSPDPIVVVEGPPDAAPSP